MKDKNTLADFGKREVNSIGREIHQNVIILLKGLVHE